MMVMMFMLLMFWLFGLMMMTVGIVTVFASHTPISVESFA